MPSFIPGVKKEQEEENFEDSIGISMQDELLNQYFQELSSLIEELIQGKEKIQKGTIKYTEQEKAKYHALIISSQKMLEIIYFEIHYSESNTRNYQDFQNYLKYKKNLSKINKYFSEFTISVESDKDSKNEDKMKEIFNNSTYKDVISHSLSEINIKDNELHHQQNIQEKTQNHYLLQSKRLLEETNQYSQQVLLNLNTQKEQLIGTNNKITNISKNIQDSSLVLDKMTKWWHQFI